MTARELAAALPGFDPSQIERALHAANVPHEGMDAAQFAKMTGRAA